jgi:hypothetical protein
MTLKTNSAEGGTDGVATSTGNSGGTSGTAWDLVNINAGSFFEYDNASPIHGAMSYRNGSTTAATTPLVGWNDSVAAVAAARLYFRFVTLPDASVQLGINFRGNAAATSLARTEFDTTGHIRAVMGATNSSFSAGAVSTGTQYRLEYVCTAFNGSAGTATANIYIGETMTIQATASLTGATTAFQPDQTRFGKFNAVSNYEWIIDSAAANIGASSELGTVVPATWFYGYQAVIG